MKTTSTNGISGTLVDIGGPGKLPELVIYALTDATLRVSFVDNSRRMVVGSGWTSSIQDISITAGNAESLAYSLRQYSPASKIPGIPDTAEGAIIKVLSGSITFGAAGTPDGSTGGGTGVASGKTPPDDFTVDTRNAGEYLIWGRVNNPPAQTTVGGADTFAPATQSASEEIAVSTTALRVMGATSWTGTDPTTYSTVSRFVSICNKDASNDLYVNFFDSTDGANTHASSVLGFTIPPGGTVFDMKVEPGMDVFVIRSSGSGRVWASVRHQ